MYCQYRIAPGLITSANSDQMVERPNRPILHYTWLVWIEITLCLDNVVSEGFPKRNGRSASLLRFFLLYALLKLFNMRPNGRTDGVRVYEWSRNIVNVDMRYAASYILRCMVATNDAIIIIHQFTISPTRAKTVADARPGLPYTHCTTLNNAGRSCRPVLRISSFSFTRKPLTCTCGSWTSSARLTDLVGPSCHL